MIFHYTLCHTCCRYKASLKCTVFSIKFTLSETSSLPSLAVWSDWLSEWSVVGSWLRRGGVTVWVAWAGSINTVLPVLQWLLNGKVMMSFFLCADFSSPDRQWFAVGLNERSCGPSTQHKNSPLLLGKYLALLWFDLSWTPWAKEAVHSGLDC